MLVKIVLLIGWTPRYDMTDLLVAFDLREWEEFFLWSEKDEEVF